MSTFRFSHRFLRSALLGVSMLSLGMAFASAQDLKNGTFDDGSQPVNLQADSKAKIEGDVALGWKDESAWAEVDVVYSIDSKGRNGSSAQKVEIRSIKKGGVQFAQNLVPEKGKRYTVTTWARSEKPGEVILQLRKAGDPYTTYAYAKANVGTEWTEIKATGIAGSSGDAFVLINPVSPGKYWFDDVTLEQTDSPAVSSSSSSATSDKTALKAEGAGLLNGGFEGTFEPVPANTGGKGKIEGSIAPGWMDESGWADVAITYSADEKEKHSGKSAQRIEVKSIKEGGVQFVQKLPLKKDRLYRATAWVRSEGSGQADLLLRQSGAPYTFYGITKVQLSQEWTEVVVAAKVTSDDVAMVMFNPAEAGVYWIDDVTVTDVTDAGK